MTEPFNRPLEPPHPIPGHEFQQILAERFCQRHFEQNIRWGGDPARWRKRHGSTTFLAETPCGVLDCGYPALYQEKIGTALRALATLAGD